MQRRRSDEPLTPLPEGKLNAALRDLQRMCARWAGDYAEARIQLPIGPQGDVFDADLAGKWISPMHPQIVRDEPGQHARPVAAAQLRLAGVRPGGRVLRR